MYHRRENIIRSKYKIFLELHIDYNKVSFPVCYDRQIILEIAIT